METKTFGGKSIGIRKLTASDLTKIKEFQNFINNLIGEKAQINLNKKISLKEEKEWLKGELKSIKNHKRVFVIAEADNKVVGTAEIYLSHGRQEHVGNLGITIRKGYRGMGLGTYLTREIIKMAKKELKPKPKNMAA